MVCPACQALFVIVGAALDEPVVCPRCRNRFLPDEEELIDPEDE